MSDGTPLTRLINRLDFARPGKAFGEGWYVTPPGSEHVAARITSRFERASAPLLLFLGGVGTGKSTALLAAQRALGARAHYLTLDTLFDEGGARPGALLVLAGLAIVHALRVHEGGTLASRLWPTWKLLHRSLKVRGRPSTPLVEPSLLEAGASETPETVLGYLEVLAKDWQEARKHGAPPIALLVDSIDRRTWPQFEKAVLPDVGELAAYDVGVVIAGSTAWRVAIDDDVRQRFHDLWSADTYSLSNPEDRAFLHAVLAARDEGLFTEAVRDAIVDCSGGVVRDLLKVADAAARDAAAEGAIAVEVRHVDAAASAMGEDAIGLLTPSLRKLFDKWHRGEPQDADERLDNAAFESLRARGCVVERGGEWSVHPLVRRAGARGKAA